ncbi:7678_t:CDS:1 [Ambispora leptoticha]|uniref:7678_t:CDS:1 n=1 Tax=Ambispora leptoticha TaxID=144679 RepID=A0A9N9DPV7_9GLOM|nr:7678_t:CDS:1 [Ambispora leptoticha]
MANPNFYNTVRANVNPPMIILLTINYASKIEVCRHELPLKMLEEKELTAQYKNITRKQANSSFLFRWTCEKSKKENSEDWFCNNQNCILNTNNISRIFNKTWPNLPKTFKNIFNELYENIKERRLKPQTDFIFITDDRSLHNKNALGLQNNNQTSYDSSINKIVTTHTSNICGNSLIDANGASSNLNGNRISYDDALNTNIYDNSSFDPDGTYSNLNETFYENSLNISTNNNHDNSLTGLDDASFSLNGNQIPYDDSLNVNIYGNSLIDLGGIMHFNLNGNRLPYDNCATTTHISNICGNSLIDSSGASSNLNGNRISYDDALNTNIYNSSFDPDGTYSNLNGTSCDNSLNISTNSNHDNSLIDLGDASFDLNGNRVSYDDSLNANIYRNSSIDFNGTYSNLNSDWASYNVATTTHTNNLYDNSHIDPCGASSNLEALFEDGFDYLKSR